MVLRDGTRKRNNAKAPQTKDAIMNAASHSDLAVPVSPIDHAKGAEHAPVTLVEYADFECPHCKLAEPVLKHLLEIHPGKLRLVFRHFPLEGVHPHALLAAQAAEAAAGQGKFWEMHDLLFANSAHLKLHDLQGYAQKLELDMTRFSAELGDEVYLQRVREHIAGAQKSGVRGTPGLFLNGRILDTSFGVQAIEQAVAKALGA
jgi:protein-disulfide isomerase